MGKWVSLFGCPITVTTGRETQFKSQRILDCHRSRTTAYHVANGMVERFHRELRTSITASDSSNWVRALSTVLLRLWSAFKPDIRESTAEFTYSRSPHLPKDHCEVSRVNDDDGVSYAQHLTARMRHLQMHLLRAIPIILRTSRTIDVITHFLRVDSVQT